MKEKDEFTRQELQTAAMSLVVRYAPLAPRNIWTIPKGKIAIHNHVEHHVGQKSGENGFRVWFDDPHVNYVERPCSARRGSTVRLLVGKVEL